MCPAAILRLALLTRAGILSASKDLGTLPGTITGVGLAVTSTWHS